MKSSVSITNLLLGVIVGVGITVAVTHQNPMKPSSPSEDYPHQPNRSKPALDERNEGQKSQAVRERWTLARSDEPRFTRAINRSALL